MTQLNLSNRILPVKPENIFRDEDYFHWCSSVIKGEDGRYHAFYSRWERSAGFDAWLTHSTVAHAVSDRPDGPYTYVETVLDFARPQYGPEDMIMAHGPKICRFEGKYYLYFISTHVDSPISDEELHELGHIATLKVPRRKELRVNQRTFVAVADSLDGPFVVNRQSLLEPTGPIKTLVVNPTVAQGPDGLYYMIVKGDRPGTEEFLRNQAVAVSKYPDRGFVMQEKPVIKDWDSEDMHAWYDPVTRYFYAMFHAHTFIGMMASENGIDWDKAEDFTVLTKAIPCTDGSTIYPHRMERPAILVEDNVPRCLSAAVLEKNGDSYIVFVPLKEE